MRNLLFKTTNQQLNRNEFLKFRSNQFFVPDFLFFWFGESEAFGEGDFRIVLVGD
jgi:hypothetical protein